MDERQALAQLRAVLADLYPDPGSIRRIAFDAGLDETKIIFSGPAADTWHAVLREAQKKGQVKTIIWVAMAEYPGVPALGVIWEGYPAAVHHEKVVPPIPQQINTSDRRGCSLITPWFSIAFMAGTISLFLLVGLYLQDIQRLNSRNETATAEAKETATAIARETATVSPTCVTSEERGVVFRVGPSTNYIVITVLDTSAEFQPLYQFLNSSDGSIWIQGELLAKGIQGWVHSAFVTCSFSLATLPIFSGELPPEHPTPTMDATSAFMLRDTENSVTVIARETAAARATLTAVVQNMLEINSSGTVSQTATPATPAISTSQP